MRRCAVFLVWFALGLWFGLRGLGALTILAFFPFALYAAFVDDAERLRQNWADIVVVCRQLLQSR
jgi:hypothetical protein